MKRRNAIALSQEFDSVVCENEDCKQETITFSIFNASEESEGCVWNIIPVYCPFCGHEIAKELGK